MMRLAILLAVLSWATPAEAFHQVMSFPQSANTGGGAGYYYTGSARNKGYDCSICHVGAERRISVALGTELASGTYKPGLIYPINVTLIGEHRGLESMFNPNTFTAEILDADGVPLGTFGAPAGGTVAVVGDGTIAVAEGFGTGETEWRFTWFAPVDGAPATLHLAMLDGDGAGATDRRFIDPLNDDVVVIALPLCPEGQECKPPPPVEEPTSPAGCSASGPPAAWWLAAPLLLLWGAGRRRRDRRHKRRS